MDTSRIDLNLLTALDVLLTEKNVTRAAQRLNLSQPALSAQLNRLRDIFDDELLIPAQRGMIPTERASQLHEPLRIALEQVRTVLARSSSFDPAKADITLSIAASDYVQYAVLIPLALDLQRSAPGVRIALHPVCGKPVEAQLERGEIHLWLRATIAPPLDLASEILMRERFVCIARRDHPRIGDTLRLDDFVACEHVFISPGGGGFSGATDVALDRLGRKRRIAVSVASFLVVPELVARSDMIAVVPERLVRDRSDRIKVLDPPLPIDSFEVAMLWHRRNDANPALVWLRRKLLALGEA
ncbi:MAG: LysR family transcriptional regulator [Hyphomicrobiaceae bacterium]|nr:LysR family transcriptional regulator [Hyphomicrobiaceae bacterium]